MAFQLSPGVSVSEIDLTTVVPAVGTTEGAFAGNFVWGPINEVVTISNEVELVDRFGKPDANTFESFFTAANFLSYARNLKLVRSASVTSAKNATGNSGLYIPNKDIYESTYLDLSTTNQGIAAARYAGELGNSLRVSVFADANTAAYSGWTYAGNFDSAPGTSVYTSGVNGANDEMHIVVVDEDGKFSGVANTVLEKFAFVSKASDAKNDDGSSNYYVNVINDRSKYVYILSHPQSVVTSANIGTITISVAGDGYSNGFITFQGGSGTGANANVTVNATGSIVGVNIINRGTGYKPGEVVVANVSSLLSTGNTATLPVTLQNVFGASNWGLPASGREFFAHSTSESLVGGVTAAPTDADLVTSYDLFKNPEEIDVSLVMAGPHSQTVAEHIVDNIATYRRDCVAFISPLKSDVVNNAGSEATAIAAYRNLFNSSSYAVMDSGWKYQFDKYNNVYRWVPLNGDIAGLCVRTDFERDPWFSPAGFNRGQIRNVIKLSWNPNKAERDDLYKIGVNPVVSFPGEGVVLYGDKTLLAKPSAFDRINVRRLFIVLEKAIARAAKYSLFEFNDEFTRAQFVALVEPFLRDVQGRRGIFDYRVVCDETNNTPEVIDRNEFVGDIYIKPARSINFIQLNFVAVRTGVAFDEIVGRFG